MWKAAVMTVGLLVALVGTARATEEHSIYGVKLCGREFIRAVIFTCGGSRWRRSVDITEDLTKDTLIAHNDEASDDCNPNSIPGLSYKPHPEAVGQGGAAVSRQARAVISEEVLEALRTSDRKGRDVVVGLSNACCKWRCSKSEISSLC